MGHDVTGAREGIEFRLVVRMSRETGWRASIAGPGATHREFATAFELARFLAWPVAPAVPSPDRGIR